MKLLIIADHTDAYEYYDRDIEVTGIYELDNDEAINKKLKSLAGPDDFYCGFYYAIYDTETKKITNHKYDCP